MAKPQFIYGKGDSRIIIAQIIQNYFLNKTQSLNSANKLNYSLILTQYDNSKYQNNDLNMNNNQYELCLTEDILQDPSKYEIREVKEYKTHQKRRTTN